MHAVKMYYQTATDSIRDIETVYLPDKVYAEFKKKLEQSNAELPEDLKVWGGCWRSAWVERFS